MQKLDFLVEGPKQKMTYSLRTYELIIPKKKMSGFLFWAAIKLKLNLKPN